LVTPQDWDDTARGAERKIHWLYSQKYSRKDWPNDLPYLNLIALRRKTAHEYEQKMKLKREQEWRIAQMTTLNMMYRAINAEEDSFTAKEVEDALEGMDVPDDLNPEFDEVIDRARQQELAKRLNKVLAMCQKPCAEEGSHTSRTRKTRSQLRI
jgi:hypothetical protein